MAAESRSLRRIGVRPTRVFFNDTLLAGAELRIEPGGLTAFDWGCWPAGSRRRSPDSRASCRTPNRRRGVTARPAIWACRPGSPPAEPGLIRSGVKAVYQKTCWAMSPRAGTGPASGKVMLRASGGRELSEPVQILAQGIDRRRAVGRAAAADGGADRLALLDPDAPFVHGAAVGQARDRRRRPWLARRR